MPKEEIKYKVIKRKVKYPRLELKTGELVVVVPHNGDLDVPNFLEKHNNWINSKQRLIKKYSQKQIKLRKNILTKPELKEKINNFVSIFIKDIKIKPKNIIIKKMKSKWGSCSSMKNITFNCLLSNLPDSIIKYLVFHEMCHLKHRKHDVNFKLLLKKHYNNAEDIEMKLFNYWFKLNRTN